MKYVFAALAVIAAVVALYIHPPAFHAAGQPADVTTPSGIRTGAPVESGRAPAPIARFVVVYVAGAVRTPGVYRLASTGRAIDALARAGGARPDADLVAVNLAEPLVDGAEIAVPKLGDHSARAARVRVPHRAHGKRRHHVLSRAAKDTPDASPVAPIDLNVATPAMLEDVPGIGPGIAARIVAYRELNGPFASVDELADVAGITPRLQDALAAAVVIR